MQYKSWLMGIPMEELIQKLLGDMVKGSQVFIHLFPYRQSEQLMDN